MWLGRSVIPEGAHSEGSKEGGHVGVSVIGRLHDGGSQILLALERLQHDFVDGVHVVQPMDHYPFSLPTAPSSRGGLVFACWVPFQRVVDYVPRCGDIESRSSSGWIENEGCGTRLVRELIDESLAINWRGPTIDDPDRHPYMASHRGGEHIDRYVVRSEYKNLCPVTGYFVDDFEASGELRARVGWQCSEAFVQ